YLKSVLRRKNWLNDLKPAPTDVRNSCYKDRKAGRFQGVMTVPRGFLCPGCETWFSRIPYPEKMGGRCPVCGGILTDLSLVIKPVGAETQPPKGGTRSGARTRAVRPSRP